MIVLVVSTLADGHAGPVMRALSRRRGVRAELLDLSHHPARLALSAEFGATDGASRLRLGPHGGDADAAIDLRSVGAVWWRRPQPPGLPEDVTDPDARALVRSECATALAGSLQCLEATWINRPDRNERAGHKPWQLHLAQAAGLTVPRTLMTNDPDAARSFCEAAPETGTVYKQFLALPRAWRETRVVDADARGRLDAVALAPVIFQHYVEAVAELRVTVIGDRVFAAAADLRDAAYRTDIRFNLDLAHVAHALPSEVADRLRDLVRRLGLVYAAIDLRLTADGDYVFLEANPAGQFLHVEQMTGLPITEALADALTGGAATRSSDPSSASLPGIDAFRARLRETRSTNLARLAV